MVWFLATSAVTVTGLIVIRSLSLNSTPGQISPYTRMAPFLLVESRHAYETGGQKALAELMARVQRVYEVTGVFTDASGKDLLTGEDRSEMIREALKRPNLSYFRRGRLVVARRSRDGAYWFFLPFAYRRLGFWIVLPEDLWLIGAV